MGPLVMAWLVGEGIIVYRSAKVYKTPPGPGKLIISSGVFVLLALVAESEQARLPATIFAWGIDIAAFMNLPKNVAGLAGAALGNVASVGAGKVGTWPPAIAPNTVIIPSGTPATSTTASTAPLVTPNLTGNLGASIGNLAQ